MQDFVRDFAKITNPSLTNKLDLTCIVHTLMMNQSQTIRKTHNLECNKQPRPVDYVWLSPLTVHSQQDKQQTKMLLDQPIMPPRGLTSTGVNIQRVLTGRFILPKSNKHRTQQVIHAMCTLQCLVSSMQGYRTWKSTTVDGTVKLDSEMARNGHVDAVNWVGIDEVQ